MSFDASISTHMTQLAVAVDLLSEALVSSNAPLCEAHNQQLTQLLLKLSLLKCKYGSKIEPIEDIPTQRCAVEWEKLHQITNLDQLTGQTKQVLADAKKISQKQVVKE